MPTSMMRRKPWMSAKDERETSIWAAKKFWMALLCRSVSTAPTRGRASIRP